jgi:hypothetical protein
MDIVSPVDLEENENIEFQLYKLYKYGGSCRFIRKGKD